MSRHQTFVVLLSLVVSMAGLAVLLVSMPAAQGAPPQSPASIEPGPYFPLQVGNRWVYSWTNSVYAPSPIVETVVVTGQVDSQYALHADHSQADGQLGISAGSGYQWMWDRMHAQNPLPLPLYMLPRYLYVPANLFPVSFQVGDVWSGTGWYGEAVYTGTTTAVISTATVSASGHTYTNCLQTHTVITGPHPFGSGTRDAWFAPDIGLVKLVYNHDDGSVTRADLLMGPHMHTMFLPFIGKKEDISAQIVLERGRTITVTTSSDEIDGDITSMDALLQNPGLDGVSLREVLYALTSSPTPATVRFDPKLKGATIPVGSWDHNQLPPLTGGSLVINGDVDGDGQADVTLENQVGDAGPGHGVFGFLIESSNNTLYALRMVGWSNAVLFDAPSTHQVYSMNSVAHIVIDQGEGAIGLYSGKGGDDQIYDNTDNAWVDTQIIGNVVHAKYGGVSIGLHRSSGDRIERLVIQGNTIILSPPAGQNPMGISLGVGYWLNKQGHVIRDVLIADNYVEGPMETGLYIASGSVGSSGNLIERVRASGNHIKQTTPVRDNGAPRDAVTITTGDGATSYGHPEADPVVYPERNIVRDIWLTGNLLEGQGGQGVSVSAGCCGARGNTIERIYILGNELRGFFPGSGTTISGVYVLGGGSGPGDAQVTSGNRVLQVFIQDNAIQLTNQRESFVGQEFISGGVAVSAGAQSENNSIEDVWIVSNEISGPVAGLTLMGGWSLTPGFSASGNTLSGVRAWYNVLTVDLVLLKPFYPQVKGINLAGGYGPTSSNRVTEIDVRENSVAGIADDVSVFQNAGEGSTGNTVDYPH